MRIIQMLADEIKDELHGAKTYAKAATQYKMEMPTLAQTFYTMAQDELKHANMLHTEAVKAIEAQRKIAEPPAYMKERWDEEHKKYVEKAAKVKYMLEMYSK